MRRLASGSVRAAVVEHHGTKGDLPPINIGVLGDCVLAAAVFFSAVVI